MDDSGIVKAEGFGLMNKLEDEGVDIRESLQSDAMFKNIFSQKKLLANVLRFVLPEFKGKSAEYVMQCINNAAGDDYNQRNSSRVSIAPTESGDGEDKLIRFDILFTTDTGIEKRAQIIIDLEMQQDIYESKLEYNIFNRITYYCARLIANQLSSIKEDGSSYNLLKPIYTIWIIGDQRKLFKDNTMVHNFGMQDVDGIIESPFDLMNIMVIELSKINKKAREDTLDHFLESLLSFDKVSLTNYFDEKELKDMSKEFNFGEEMKKEGEKKGREEGEKKGREEGEKKGREEGIYGSIFICRDLNISEEEIARKLQEKFQLTEKEAKEFLAKAV